MRKFMKICRKSEMELKGWLEKLLKAKYKEVVNEDGFLYARGNAPILLTAHMDTVHKEKCKEIVVEKLDGETILSSPQGIGGDDRCGVWIIRQILTKTKYRPYVLFCEQEEVGGVGSEKFTRTDYVDELKEMKYLIELDRANYNDAVYYDCGNEDFMGYIEEMIGYKEAHGSFSDISNLSPKCDVASVNLSCGYYRAHTLNEYVIFEEMFDTYKAVKKLLANAKDCERFDYQEKTYSRWDYNDWYSGNYFKSQFTESETDYTTLFDTDSVYEILYEDVDGEEKSCIIDANSYAEAIGYFLMENGNLTFNSVLDWFECAS